MNLHCFYENSRLAIIKSYMKISFWHNVPSRWDEMQKQLIMICIYSFVLSFCYQSHHLVHNGKMETNISKQFLSDINVYIFLFLCYKKKEEPFKGCPIYLHIYSI